jgi:hypothetical protein
MSTVSRGFRGRWRPSAELPPGQYLVEDFPVLSAVHESRNRMTTIRAASPSGRVLPPATPPERGSRAGRHPAS